MKDFFFRLLLLAIVVTAPFPVAAHEAQSGWTYPWSCCSGHDCRQISASMVRAGPNGYELPNGETIPYDSDALKPSPDGEFHWCTRDGRDDTPTICLFFKMMGS